MVLQIHFECTWKLINALRNWPIIESAFEAAPQTLIQSYFLIKTTFYTNKLPSGLVVLSVIASLFSVVWKAINEDKALIKDSTEPIDIGQFDLNIPNSPNKTYTIYNELHRESEMKCFTKLQTNLNNGVKMTVKQKKLQLGNVVSVSSVCYFGVTVD